MKPSTLVWVSTAALVAGCVQPVRAPRQPVPGVDVAHTEGANPHDSPGGASQEPFLGSLVPQLTSQYVKEPGVVAIFPALTHSRDRGTNVVNGLGEHLARETASSLEKNGVAVLSASHLVQAIRRAGRQASSYATVADAWSLAEIAEATYFVTGRADHRVFDLEKRDEHLEIDWLCRKVKGGEIVARYRTKLTGGPLANDLIRHYRLQSEWEAAVRLDGPPSDG